MTTVVVAGATGFVGSGIVQNLSEAGYNVTALVRKRSTVLSDFERVNQLICDPFISETYIEHISDADIFINSVGIIREKPSRGVTFERIHTELNSIFTQAAIGAGIKKFILVSALGARKEGITRYQTSKNEAEEALKASGLQWVIFHPSFVLGPGSGFLSEIGPITALPIIPVFGKGDYQFEPVHRDVLAAAIISLIHAEDHRWNKTYELRGSQAYSYKEILGAIARHLHGKNRPRFIRIPLWLVKPMVWLTGWLPFAPITMDQLRMLLEGNTGNGINAVQELNLHWYDIDESLERS